MATPEPQPKPIERVNSGDVIVYDLAIQTITTQKAEKYKDQEAKLFNAPRFSNHVDLWDDSRLIARLDLDKLGWGTTTKRWFGKCKQIQMVRS
ncbi:hypothetical protein JMJ35_003455 [Cladonia borealis]|uniref:Uncharacterized protein n=1 Tax=Cladonia borealis TaxID=184061 RepID=A0AA39V2Q6_9LECA|nr:hypothetical protein JMJ35_003455 [Cladonia borealis]